MTTRITFRGTGQLNGPVIIDKTVDLDDKSLRPFYGAKRDEVMTAFIGNHYPGVKINPRQISIIQENKINPKKTSQKSRALKSNSSKSKSFSIFSLIFLPFKIVGKIISWLTKGNHY